MNANDFDLNAAEGPPRLVEDSGLTDAIRWTQQEGLSTARLAKGESAILLYLDNAPAAGLASAQASASMASGVAVKIILPLIMATGLGLYFSGKNSGAEKKTPSYHGEIIETEAEETKETELIGGEKEKSDKEKSAAKVKHPSKKRIAQVPSNGSSNVGKGEGSIKKQLALFTQAKESADRGDFTEALLKLKRLKEKYPKSVLTREIDLSRTHYLVAAGHLTEAVAQIQILRADENNQNRQGELLRLLGDVWIKRGHCQRALESYQKAKKYSLSPNEAAAIKRGILKCRN